MNIGNEFSTTLHEYGILLAFPRTCPAIAHPCRLLAIQYVRDLLYRPKVKETRPSKETQPTDVLGRVSVGRVGETVKD